jgi:hypothetical protein
MIVRLKTMMNVFVIVLGLMILLFMGVYFVARKTRSPILQQIDIIGKLFRGETSRK